MNPSATADTIAAQRCPHGRDEPCVDSGLCGTCGRFFTATASNDALTDDPPRSLDTARWRILEWYDFGDTVTALRDGTLQRPAPEIGQRDDGQGLFYRGRVNGIAGPSGSGKSWVALHVALQHIRDENNLAQTVIYVDYEDSTIGTLGRMVDLGATDTDLGGFYYIHPDDPFSFDIRDEFMQNLEWAGADGYENLLVIIDSTGEAMALDGYESALDKDYSTWHRRLPLALTNLGVTVLLVDHINKNDERTGDSLHATGTLRKRAAISGASYMLRPTKPFAKGHDGAAQIVCAKDRCGTYRQGEKVADFTVTSGVAGTLTAALVAPGVDVDTTFRPTHLMERVSRFVEMHRGESKRTILDSVNGKRTALVTALDVLIEEGYIGIDKVGQTHQHTSLKAYREDEDQ